MDYLHTIKDHVFPILVSDVDGLECIRVLDAAELVYATFEPDERAGTDAAAVVHRITALGWAALRRHARGERHRRGAPGWHL
jgi:hypothetical protein